MNKIDPNKIPDKLSDQMLYLLAEMAEKSPVSQEWIEISKKLTNKQKFLIYEMRSKVQENKEKIRQKLLSVDEKKIEKAKWDYMKNNPNKFYGNMGQPETADEYKNRYGIWPPGYNQETGEKLSDF